MSGIHLAVRGIGVASAGSAQVDDGGQILLSRERRRGDPQPGDRIGDVPIQQGGRQLDGVAG
jgi:hypothetical protein